MTMLIFTGCGSQEYNIVINDDETCTVDVRLSISKDAYSLIGSYGMDMTAINADKSIYYGGSVENVDVLFQEVANEYATFGYSISPVDDAFSLGFEASKLYQTPSDLNKEILLMKNKGISGLSFEIGKSETNTSKEYTLYGELEYMLDPDISMTNEVISENIVNMIGLSGLTAKATVSMPPETTVSAMDGVYENQEFTWFATIESTEATPVHIISSYTNSSLIMLFGVIVFLVVAIIIFFVLRKVKLIRDKKSEPEYDEPEYEDDEDAFS